MVIKSGYLGRGDLNIEIMGMFKDSIVSVLWYIA